MKNLLTFILLGMWVCSSTHSSSNLSAASHQPGSSELCDNPDGDVSCCFVSMPKNLSERMKIGKGDERGEPLTITGTIYRSDGRTPYGGIIMYAYQTDARGYYSKDGTEKGIQKWHGKLHGWCKTDENGQYEITTIRPAPYPSGDIPAHIHAALKLPDGGQSFYINDFVFKDDKLVNKEYIGSLRNAGGTRILAVKRTSEGWVGERDIILE